MNTKPTIPTEELLERLRRTDQAFGWSGPNGDKWCEYANPDGPEAADCIEALEAALGKLEHLIARQALTTRKV